MADFGKADALASLEGHEGWQVFEGWIKESIERSKDSLASKKSASNMVEVARLQGKYEVLVSLLFLRQKAIDDAIAARNKDKADD